MDSNEIRQKFLSFFEKKGHKIISSSSLIPDDPSVLLTTAGMQRFKKYFTGELDAEKDFKLDDGTPAKGTVSIQKCFRIDDIDEIGDDSHLTFFEMLGNFSFIKNSKKNYIKFHNEIKREAIESAYEFITDEMELKIDYVTVFSNDKVEKGDWRKSGASFDQLSYNFWENIFKKEGLNEREIKEKIHLEGVDNFWGPTGSEGPCGPTTEIYAKTIEGKSVEIWNIVFNTFYCDKNKTLIDPMVLGIDTGMGLERLAVISQGVKNIYETDVFNFIIDFLNKNLSKSRPDWSKRIIADHVRGIIFLIVDGVLPSNKDVGYILRKLIRRTISHLVEFQYFELTEPGEPISQYHFEDALEIVIKHTIKKLELDSTYKDYIEKNVVGDSKFIGMEGYILKIIRDENNKFIKTYRNGKKILDTLIYKAREDKTYKIFGDDLFDLITVNGFSMEWIKDIAKMNAIELDIDGFQKEFEKHQEISRAGAEKKFGGHGLILDTGELKAGSEEERQKVVRLHTATHLLHKALREVLGDEVGQRGSDITSERARFDFVFPRKMTEEEIKKTEEIVNQKIKEALSVNFKEMPKEEAEKTGALKFFKGNYPDIVKVYYVGDSIENAYSKEFCGGPHVSNTKEIGKFKITKEESSSAGIRRIRAIVS